MSKRQLQIYEYIKGYIKKHQYSPTIKEITDAVGLKSTSTTHGHIERMRKQGYIDFINMRSRTLQILR